MSKTEFKYFVRKHPELANYILKDNNTTWQKLYELYEMYGENSSVWNSFFKVDNTTVTSTVGSFIDTIKGVDMNTVQKGIENIQKTIGLLQDIGIGSATNNNLYQPRPLYQHFDD